MRKCNRCGMIHPPENFWKSDVYCKECRKAFKKECRRTKPEYFRETARQAREMVKLLVITHYSEGKVSCAYCDMTNIDALSIDHIYDNGNSHRKKYPGATNIYNWAKRNGFPEGLQVLCMNCQFIKAAEKRRRQT